MSEEKLEFTPKLLIFGNLAVLVWVVLSFLSVWFFNSIYSWLYLAFLAFIIYAVLRRLGCSSCYKCKTCTSGFGRLADDFFGRGFTKRESVGNRLGLVAFVYFLLFPLPAAFLCIKILGGVFSVFEAVVLACLFALAIYSLTTWFKRSVPRKR